MIAALYVDPHGPYPRMAGVDAWDASRRAETYRGPHPVVAHPPCGPWGHLSQFSRRPQDSGLAVIAVGQVRAYGGALEHPAGSKLWDAGLGLPRPGARPDAWGGFTVEVCQVDWGHVARKRSWIYLVGVRELGPMPPPREPTHWVSGSRTAPRGPVPPGIKVCSAPQRRKTPPAFAAWLVSLAQQAQK